MAKQQHQSVNISEMPFTVDEMKIWKIDEEKKEE